MHQPPPTQENTAVAARYARRDAERDAARYSLFNPAALQAHQERQRAMLALWRGLGWPGLAGRDITEVGCGAGGNLADLLRLGADPESLTGIDLLPERIHTARERLPAAVRLLHGDAAAADIAPQSQDMVLAFTVFSSILDAAVQARLASLMWAWLRPGGGVLWYDFAVDNPRNADVRGVPVPVVKALFPAAQPTVRRLTLAPPMARAVARLHPRAPEWFNLWPLRTHRLIWLAKLA